MCTLSIVFDKAQGCLRVVASRDELRNRPEALPPRWREIGGAERMVRAIWPTDPLGGGTWIGAADTGVVLGLMNLNPEPEPVLPPNLVSRGLIIPRLIDAPCARDAVEQLEAMDLQSFAPFTLVAAESGGPGCASSPDPWRERNFRLYEARWDGTDLQVAPHKGTTACFVSSRLGDSKVRRRLHLFQSLVASDPTPQTQDDFHIHTWPDHPELSVLMSRADARTVSITNIEVTPPTPGVHEFGVRMGYRPIPDDAALPMDVSRRRRVVAGLGRGG